ncbi:MAG: tRNA lysidine(34) synthetase TilS [Oscillospiraceae bacterium]|nr:tRNA lysidine(34) synthetase TilS [Oscillospiraceae bacterium]
MKNKLREELKSLLPRGATLCAALSGGADSVAMTHCLYTLQEELGFTLTACHFNHCLRGEESHGDEAFCVEFCQSFGIPLSLGREDVAHFAKVSGKSVEEAARYCRYAFFEGLEGYVATAHTATDAAETVLLNLLRGTGLKGLGGIPRKRGKFLRPMLSVTREEILVYLDENHLPHREDSSNQSDDHLRNRLRHHVIPHLVAENPNFYSTMARSCALLREDEELLETMAQNLLQGNEKEGYALSPLREAPAPLRRRALRWILEGKVEKLNQNHLLLAEEVLFSSQPSASMTLPKGLCLRRKYDRLLLTEDQSATTFSPVTLPCPGEVSIPQLGLKFSCKEAGASITIRPRKVGDKIRLRGGTKSVKNLLIDAKIPLKERECIPILERDGRVISVWGVANSQDMLPITAQPIEKEETTV